MASLPSSTASTGDPFAELAMLLLAAAVAGAVAVRARQPVLMAYLVVGIVAGPAVLGLVSAHDQIDLLAQVGVAVLLFVVGLKLDLQHVRHIGPVALATGLGQLGFTIVIGFALTLALGKGWLEALYVAVALTFSSTIIIVKLLSDKRELDSLHGRIAVGFLIVQDLAVVAAMVLMSAMRSGGAEGASAWTVGGELALRVTAAVLLTAVLMRWVLPRLVALMARSQELLLVFAVAWGVAIAGFSEWAGFSKEAGAFLAGFMLASTPWREAMSARLTGLRDFLLLFFFIDLGAKLELGALGAELVPAIVLSLFVLIGNPLIVMAIMGFMGYRRRTGFMAGLTVAQISEFSIIFIGMGVAVGHVDPAALGLVTLVGLVTITLSTYMILYSQRLYGVFERWLGPFERRDPFREREMEEPPRQADVIVFGLGRYGCRLAERLSAQGVQVLGVDFDPEVLARGGDPRLQVVFGDAADDEFLAHLPLASAQWVVSTLRTLEQDRALVLALRRLGYRGRLAVTAHSAAEAERLREAGADAILLPFQDAADHAAERVFSDCRGHVERPAAAP